MMVGPESPQYVDIPNPLQEKHLEKKPVKGTLPVPREIFPHRRPDKPTKFYLDDATKKPSSNKPKTHPKHPHRESEEWKRQMASVRRKNLRAGLTELYQRKRRTETDLAKSSRRKLRYARTVQQQPPRDDERLTRPSTTKMMQDKQLVYGPDPHAEKHLAESKERVVAKQDGRRRKRMEAIQTLYMNARHFITTEKQLTAEIDKVFPEGDNIAWANNRLSGENIWNVGRPMTVEDMVARMHNEDAKHEAVQRRTHKLAETLTGGTLDDTDDNSEVRDSKVNYSEAEDDTVEDEKDDYSVGNYSMAEDNMGEDKKDDYSKAQGSKAQDNMGEGKKDDNSKLE